MEGARTHEKGRAGGRGGRGDARAGDALNVHRPRVASAVVNTGPAEPTAARGAAGRVGTSMKAELLGASSAVCSSSALSDLVPLPASPLVP